MKLIVETKGSFQLLDPLTGKTIRYNKPTLVTSTSFIDRELGNGNLRLLKSGIADTATDAEFEKYIAETKGDTALLCDSFASSFPMEDAPTDEEIMDNADKANGAADVKLPTVAADRGGMAIAAAKRK